jgi:sRNA-binding carbon storage regulator CsrA
MFVMIVNITTTKVMGIEAPKTLLLHADEVIEGSRAVRC